MGSYIARESPPADPLRPRVGRNPRELLRERLSRPNHAVQTPVRKLSFTGETLNSAGKFNITPQRHYPLQQPGVSAVGILPPLKWESFKKKNVLSPRNSPLALSPVTVKIGRPDHNTPSLDHLSCAGQSRAPADPCSRESVLRVLKESRKREVEDEDRSFTAEQRNKRRRNDSGGSAHSAFEPLLPNGTQSQLVPKPGSLKRGMTSLTEESIIKRSRTSSISSSSGIYTSRGTPGTRRNAIQSSYSSSLGFNQLKRLSAPSSPLSSPGSSRCHTPEGVSKRPREDDGQSPSSASSVRSDQTASDKAPVTSKQTPTSNVPVTTSTDSTGSGGKRKRKIPLVSSHRNDHISLPPPPPELGYTITVKDLDEEKWAGISKIQKALETPAPEPEKPVSPLGITSTQAASSSTSTSTSTLSSLLASPLPITSSSAIPVINLDPSLSSSISTTSAAPNQLLDALKMKITTPSSSTNTAGTTTASVSTTPVQPSSFSLNPSIPVDTPQPPPASQSSPASVEQPSAFARVLGQGSKAASSTPPAAGSGLFGLTAQISTPSASSVSSSTATATSPASTSTESGSVSTTNSQLVSEFKPVFALTTTTVSSATTKSTTPVSNFKPIFGETPVSAAFGLLKSLTSTNPVSTVSSTTTASLFGGSTSTTTAPPPAYPGLTNNTPASTASTGSVTTTQTQPSVKSLFGKWPTPSTLTTSAPSVQALNAGSMFQFGAAPTTTAPAAPAAATTASSQAPLTFGTTQADPQVSTQKVFTFGQVAPAPNTTTTSFGGFAMASVPPTTAPATTQSTFSFGKSVFEAPTAQPTFGSSSAAPPKPFTFGGNAASTAPTSAPTPFTFGAATTTTATTFGTPVKPAFGVSSSGFAFGGTTVPSAIPSAQPSFGGATQTQSAPSSSTFTFGGATPQSGSSGPVQPVTGGFNFSAGLPQFGTPVSNNSAPQMGSFNFGAAATDKPAFGTLTPTFGQGAAVGSIPFGSPGTSAQGFNAAPFGTPATPSFSIGAGSKPSGARQRLQARRQHNRKK